MNQEILAVAVLVLSVLVGLLVFGLLVLQRNLNHAKRELAKIDGRLHRAKDDGRQQAYAEFERLSRTGINTKNWSEADFKIKLEGARKWH